MCFPWLGPFSNAVRFPYLATFRLVSRDFLLHGLLARLLRYPFLLYMCFPRFLFYNFPIRSLRLGLCKLSILEGEVCCSLQVIATGVRFSKKRFATVYIGLCLAFVFPYRLCGLGSLKRFTQVGTGRYNVLQGFGLHLGFPISRRVSREVDFVGTLSIVPRGLGRFREFLFLFSMVVFCFRPTQESLNVRVSRHYVLARGVLLGVVFRLRVGFCVFERSSYFLVRVPFFGCSPFIVRFRVVGSRPMGRGL